MAALTMMLLASCRSRGDTDPAEIGLRVSQMRTNSLVAPATGPAPLVGLEKTFE